MAEETASESKVLEEVDESDAHMSTLDSLEADAESDGAPNMSDSSSVTSVFESLRQLPTRTFTRRLYRTLRNVTV